MPSGPSPLHPQLASHAYLEQAGCQLLQLPFQLFPNFG